MAFNPALYKGPKKFRLSVGVMHPKFDDGNGGHHIPADEVVDLSSNLEVADFLWGDPRATPVED